MRRENTFARLTAGGMRRLAGATVFVLFSATVAPGISRAEKPVKRVVIALYDGAEEQIAHETRIHRFLTMPLNHLGLIVRQFDIRKGEPPAPLVARARGVVTWFTDKSAPAPDRYITWLWSLAKNGARVAIFGHPGVVRGQLQTTAGRRAFDRLFAALGLSWKGLWVSQAYATKVTHVDTRLYAFERSLPPLLTGYPILHASDDGQAQVALTVRDELTGRRSDLVVIGPRGGYVAEGYALFHSRQGGHIVQKWYLNPFRFFARVFATDGDPKPDVTTMSGRRIFYSHVDGDAWHNRTTVEAYLKTPTVSAKVIFDKILRGFPDLPHTIAPVTGDLDKDWYGSKKDRDLARRIFRLPNVEAGTHTLSHPFSWGFFAYNPTRAELAYLPRYPARPGKSQSESIWKPTDPDKLTPVRLTKLPFPLPSGFRRPRAYAVKRYDLKAEIVGSVHFLEKHVLPPGKKVKIIQWSGDTTPGKKALRLSRNQRLRNINGGDPRMDGEFKSYSWVCGLARRVGDDWQIYSSGANDHAYTRDWHGNFSGFRRAVDSFKNMETPIRIKPIDIYYHLYSAERSDALNALLYAFHYARSQRIAPVWTSDYAAMVDGFLSARIVKLGDNRWRIENRGKLETIRFDRATLKAIDFARSVGVIGQKYFQGSLYVALDRAVAKPIIALKKYNPLDGKALADRPYLVDARWRTWSLSRGKVGFEFKAQGFGTGTFLWKVPAAGRYRIIVTTIEGAARSMTAEADTRGLLSFSIRTNDAKPRFVAVSRIGI